MKHGIAMLLAAASANVFATDSLDCEAAPYHLALVVSSDFGPQDFRLYKDGKPIFEGRADSLQELTLNWVNPVAAPGNSLSLRGTLSGGLRLAATAKGAVGSLEVDGHRYRLLCDWQR